MQIAPSIFNHTGDLTASSISATLRPWSMLMESPGESYCHYLELSESPETFRQAGQASKAQDTLINEVAKPGTNNRKARFM